MLGVYSKGHTWAEMGLEGAAGGLWERERASTWLGLGAFTAEGLDLALGWASTLRGTWRWLVRSFLLRRVTS